VAPPQSEFLQQLPTVQVPLQHACPLAHWASLVHWQLDVVH
jgi:hypothetical protein